jgi:hypothetical protein
MRHAVKPRVAAVLHEAKQTRRRVMDRDERGGGAARAPLSLLSLKTISRKIVEKAIAKKKYVSALILPTVSARDGMTRVPDDLARVISDVIAYTTSRRAQGKPSVVCVSGARGSGKNLTARLVANAILFNEGRVAVLDGDVGNPLCGAPGMLTLSVFHTPLTAPGSEVSLSLSHAPPHVHGVFVGTSGKNNPALYVTTIAALHGTWRELDLSTSGHDPHDAHDSGKKRKKTNTKTNAQTGPPCLVVNCVQWQKGIASDLVMKTIQVVNAHRVVRVGAVSFPDSGDASPSQPSLIQKSPLEAQNGTLQWMLWGLGCVSAHGNCFVGGGGRRDATKSANAGQSNNLEFAKTPTGAPVWEFLADAFASMSPWRVSVKDVRVVGDIRVLVSNTRSGNNAVRMGKQSGSGDSSNDFALNASRENAHAALVGSVVGLSFVEQTGSVSFPDPPSDKTESFPDLPSDTVLVQNKTLPKKTKRNSTCFGLGLVRSADCEFLWVLTNLPPEALAKVNAVVVRHQVWPVRLSQIRHTRR